jgi:hypothetical protein
MDEVTQQNSALVEQATATAKTLDQQAQAMSEQVSFFRLEDDAKSHTRAHTSRSAAAAPARAATSGAMSAQRSQASRPRAVANGGR